MNIFHQTIIILGFAAIFLCRTDAKSETEHPRIESFLPKTAVQAWYVEIERDPKFDDCARRMREAREKNPEWFMELSRKLQGTSGPAPYHENFGVTKEEYEHFIHPINHFRELSRKEIRIVRKDLPGQAHLDLEGVDLLLGKVTVNTTEQTATTGLGILPKREFVDLTVASTPPGRSRGIAFSTPNERVVAEKKRESLLIGELKDKDSGIIHYSLNTPGQLKMIYIEFPK